MTDFDARCLRARQLISKIHKIGPASMPRNSSQQASQKRAQSPPLTSTYFASRAPSTTHRKEDKIMQSGLHNKPLLPRFTTQADHRRIEPEEMIAIARERLGVALVAGLERVVGGTHIESTADHRPVAASMYLLQAHKISLEPGSMIEWQTAVAPYDTPRNGVVFAFPIAFGNGSPFPQPTGQFDLYINDDHITSFTIDKRSRRWSGSRGTLIFEAQWTKATAFGNSFNLDEQIINESQYSDGYALIHCPRHTIPEGRPSRIRITATTEVQSKNWLRVGQMGRPLEHDDLVNTLFKALPSPPQPTVGDYIVLNGDLHNHSGQSYLLGKEGCGSGTRQSLFEYARHVAGLDFFALSEHDWQMNDDDWMELNALTDSFHDPGNFLTLHGYEWTSAGHGHRNVYFRDEPGPIHRSRPIGAGHSALETNPTPEDLWRSLDQDGLAAITVPHHMSAARFPLSLRQHFQQKYDVAAEIYSSWGNSLEPDNRLNTYV